ncbi:hypothetical protein DL95DRAFT_463566 [Leptodontidium sp. 2 PMI_412]|nr:hypothetical protein DL95DRAFT_463566 [Leptodontidium sp. 2 PMI_412]
MEPQNYLPDRYLGFTGADKFKHATAAHKHWPYLRHVVAGLDPDYPINVELSREPLDSHASIPFCLSKLSESSHPTEWCDSMTLAQIRQLMDYYFLDLHLSYPVLDKETVLQASLRKLLENGIRDDEDSCLMLLVFALGSQAAYHHRQTMWSH